MCLTSGLGPKYIRVDLYPTQKELLNSPTAEWLQVKMQGSCHLFLQLQIFSPTMKSSLKLPMTIGKREDRDGK